MLSQNKSQKIYSSKNIVCFITVCLRIKSCFRKLSQWRLWWCKLFIERMCIWFQNTSINKILNAICCLLKAYKIENKKKIYISFFFLVNLFLSVFFSYQLLKFFLFLSLHKQVSAFSLHAWLLRRKLRQDMWKLFE